MRIKPTIMWQMGLVWVLIFPQALCPLAGPPVFLPQVETISENEHLKAEHQRVLDELNVKDAKGNVMELDDPRVPALIKRGWDLAGAWAAAYLEAHSSPSQAELENIFDGFAPKPHRVKSKYGDFLEYADYNFEGRAVEVGPSIYVITARYIGVDFPTGTFMVVARNLAGRFQALWNVKDLAEKHYPQRDEIGRWIYLVGRAYYNGPLDIPDVVLLPAAANGHTRFLIKTLQGADGNTVLGQLSIWEWDGTEAQPLLAQAYEFSLEEGGDVSIHDGVIQITTKEELGVLFSSAPSPEPRAVWTIRITPAGIQDMGRRFLQPEIKWADELLLKIIHNEDTSHLANAMVVKALKSHVAEMQAELKPDEKDQDKSQFMWGMLEECRVLHRGSPGAFVLVIDGEHVRFTYVRRQGRPYFTRVRFQS